MYKRNDTQELIETLNCRYRYKGFKKKNPRASYRETTFEDNVNAHGLIFTNGKRRLYVRVDRFKADKIHKDYKGNWIMNVSPRSVKDYEFLVDKIDKAMKYK